MHIGQQDSTGIHPRVPHSIIGPRAILQVAEAGVLLDDRHGETGASSDAVVCLEVREIRFIIFRAYRDAVLQRRRVRPQDIVR